MKTTKYRWKLQSRFHSEFSTQPDWVTLSYHATKAGAEEALKWHLKFYSFNCDLRIIENN